MFRRRVRRSARFVLAVLRRFRRRRKWAVIGRPTGPSPGGQVCTSRRRQDRRNTSLRPGPPSRLPALRERGDIGFRRRSPARAAPAAPGSPCERAASGLHHRLGRIQGPPRATGSRSSMGAFWGRGISLSLSPLSERRLKVVTWLLKYPAHAAGTKAIQRKRQKQWGDREDGMSRDCRLKTNPHYPSSVA